MKFSADRALGRLCRLSSAGVALVCSVAAYPSGSAVSFADVTADAGIRFKHVRGGSGEKYMVETLGAGAAFFDYDNDGRLDLYLVNSAPLPGFVATGPLRNILYRNAGDRTFGDVTTDAGVGEERYGMGTAVADYDNDGFPDLYVTNFGPDVLFHNNGDGTFADVTLDAGLGQRLWGASGAFGDIDADGYLDLYVVNYVDFGLDNHKVCMNPATGLRDYCHPDVYNGLPDFLYRNNGDGTFSDVTRDAGVYTSEGKGLGVVFGDYDNDGDDDIYVANDSVRNFLFRNNGEGSFEEVGLLTGVAYNEEGTAEAGMGTDFGDYDNDGDLDVFVTNLDLETNTLYQNLEGSLFADVTFVSGMALPSLYHVGFGTGFLDYDNDGDLDVFIANGHILDTVDVLEGKVTFEQPNLLLRNDGSGGFENVSVDSGAHFSTRKSSRGAAFGDYDNDGDVDILVTNSDASPNLLRNEGGNVNHKLVIKVIGTTSNRDGVGARLSLSTGGFQQIREVHGGYSYLSHNDLRVVFGLGRSTSVERLEVRWPTGNSESYVALTADHLVVIKEGVGIVQTIALPQGE